jgi:hypothetical protein
MVLQTHASFSSNQKTVLTRKSMRYLDKKNATQEKEGRGVGRSGAGLLLLSEKGTGRERATTSIP